jgi:hypothetical protein
MTEKISCPICVESYYLYNIVTCPSCNFSCCKTCMKTYILNSENDSVICMNRECNKRFLKTTLFQLLPINWLNKEFKEIIFKLDSENLKIIKIYNLINSFMICKNNKICFKL